MPIHYFTEPTDPPTPAPTAALTPPKSPVPVTVSLRRLEVYREEAAPLREYLDGYDSNGQLSRLLLMAAVSLMEDLLLLISTGGKPDESLQWDPLAELPVCVLKAAGDELPGQMLILIADIAASFTRGYTQPDTTIGALAMELIIEEAIFIAELWHSDITSSEIKDLRDPLFMDTDHFWLYYGTRKLSKKNYRGLFESYFDHKNGQNGLHPFVEPR